MKVMIFTLSCLFLIFPLLAIQVSGNQSGTWTVENSPYIMIGDVTVSSGQTLTVDPGVTVLSQGNYQITVQGLLLASGTQADSILFGISADNTGGIWQGIRLENVTGTDELHYCDIRYAETGVNVIAAQAVIMNCHFYGNKKGINCFGIGSDDPSSIMISRCNIEYSKENAIYIVEHRNVSVIDCDISNNGVASSFRAAIHLSIQSAGANCSPFIENNHIHHNRWQGITAADTFVQGTMEPQITNNNIEYNYTGIYLLNSDGQVQHNDITNNFIPGNMNSGAGVMVSGASSTPMFYDNVITGNYTGFYLASNANPCIGDLSEDVITYWGRNTISNNIDANGTLHSIYLYQYTNAAIVVKAENNDWGTEDTLAIALSIQDHADDPALGIVDFMPISNGTPVQSISGRIYPLEGMISCEVRAISVSNPNDFVSVMMNQNHTYMIPLENPGVYYVTAYGYMFEDINPSIFSAYGDTYEPQPVDVWLTSHVENINIIMHDLPEYLYSKVGASFQQDNLTLFPLQQGRFVTPIPYITNLYKDNTSGNIKIHSFSFSTGNPIVLTDNNILVPVDVMNYGQTWSSSRMIYNEDIWEWQLAQVTSTVVGNENLLFNDNIINCWIVENSNASNEIISKEWYALTMGLMKAVYYDAPFMNHTKFVQYMFAGVENSYLPLASGNQWFYFFEQPSTPTELVCMPGNATNFFSWEPPIQGGETPWTHYKFYEDDVILAQLPIEQPNYGVLQDFYHTHRYYVTAWREGWESSPSNIVIIDGVPNSDNIETPMVSKLSIYPNPCNMSQSNMNIKFNLQKTESATILIYNVRGQKVRTLHFDSLAKGSQTITWDDRNDDHKQVVDGVYLVKMDLNKQSVTQKVVLQVK